LLAAGTGHAQSPPAAPGPVVILRTDNPNPRLLQQSESSWYDVCGAPCGLRVNPAGLYRIGGRSVRLSDPFRLQRPSGDVVIDVQAGSQGKHFVGLGLMIGGLAAIGIGVGSWVIARSAANHAYGQLDRDADNRMAWELGLLFGGLGAVLEAVGIHLWSSHTSVQIH
jgi:hypothetical protein